MARSLRLVGTAGTLEFDSACSGWRRAAKEKKLRMAARRAFLVRTLVRVS